MLRTGSCQIPTWLALVKTSTVKQLARSLSIAVPKRSSESVTGGLIQVFCIKFMKPAPVDVDSCRVE